MDAVITYVNGLDPIWQKQYSDNLNAPLCEERFRDWGTLVYLFRGIEKNMPFIRNVYLVVACESQVPAWVNRKTVHVVLHKDIIPEKYLPTFNSTTIEMFLHKIEGLDEEFLYFNDDCFPIKKCNPKMFFESGKACVRFHKYNRPPNLFNRQARNSSNMARKTAGLEETSGYIRPQHITSAMLKSVSKEVFDRNEEEILSTLSKTRENKNLNQYLFLDYAYYTGKTIDRRIPYRYFSFAVHSMWTISRWFRKPDSPLLCLNDGTMNISTFRNFKRRILKEFNLWFPKKSKFEK